ncbi:hypothetical protein CEP54_000509 [Fusarium duplospermum]|uniref:Uncharacterized protein n=1 Tax=Fusarium duplospermum TaxID=1325734 RepID=A0A428R6W1_9HYPO|nr:hypothetical protein CEP54_000509 [Fusarium duplospermum]
MASTPKEDPVRASSPHAGTPTPGDFNEAKARMHQVPSNHPSCRCCWLVLLAPVAAVAAFGSRLSVAAHFQLLRT